MITITIGQEKGGIAKTSLAITLASALAIRGAQVLLVDTDAQASATNALGIADSSALYDVLVRGQRLVNSVCPVPCQVYTPDDSPPSLLLLPSNVEARNIASMLTDLDAVARKFAELEGLVDIVIFDTPPTPSLFHAAIYAASDYIIWPVVPEPLAIDGLVKSMSRLRGISSIRQSLGKAPTVPLGIVPTMVRPQTVLHQTNLDALRKEYGALVKSPISQRIAWSEAAQMRQSIFAYSPGDVAATEAWRFVDECMEGVRVHDQLA